MSETTHHIDLNIVESDLSLDDILSPTKLTKQQVIAQDIKHRILESGLLVRLVGLRNNNAISTILTELELIVEQDERLIPGTIELYYNSDKTIKVLADTYDYGKIEASNVN
ncbi:DUF2590 family protein [Thalassotalea sp. 1_MG-2023]|uniref:DUF2590 family protein n=1 Tax=Thalassotalea sp. 1_MG-2023 TaxID=3062680 RepID=UPI0026E477C3|nr:DUF2590 family protein [Thalassotalea sp. 1_MG-2023]MDO6426240.1 DUF2590 family protein [Thalassotalea sp. 1_MG-2023]